jgi:hypothetical protein
MIDEVLINLAGYSITQDKATYLTAPITTLTSPSSAPTVISLGNSDSLGKGLVEIDEELLYIDSYDKVGKTGIVAPFGRGYLGSTAATHAVDSKVTISPTFPRTIIKRNINDTIKGMGNALQAIKTTTFTFVGAQTTYGFNNLNIQTILKLEWQNIGPSKSWQPIRRWDWDSKADESVWGTGAQTITISDAVVPGRTVKVTYFTDPVAFTDSAQDFNDQTGLPESARDVVVLGAAWRSLAFLDPARASMTSPQADETNAKRPFGSSNSAAKQLYAFYTQRLNEEVKRQQQLYPPKIHYTR